VAPDDVLNIRERPSADAPVVGELRPGATGVEVLAIRDGWALVAAGEGAGHVAARFLQRDDGSAWFALQTPLRCLGTEPFWSLSIDPAAGRADYLTPEADLPQTWRIGAVWPGRFPAQVPAQVPAQSAALSLPVGTAVLTPVACSDGMSDRPFGIAVDLFLTEPAGARLSGCCSLVEP
jgi:uncharacterized membrane protein